MQLKNKQISNKTLFVVDKKKLLGSIAVVILEEQSSRKKFKY